MVVKEYARRFCIRTFVETGTFQGAMIRATRQSFDRIYSIELDENLYQRAKKEFSSFDHITIIHGDSSEVLPVLLAEIVEPCLFWLDAHFSGGITAKGTLLTPIKQELIHIFTHPIKDHVVLIDDARLFNGQNDYPTLEELRHLVLNRLPDGILVVEDDIIRIHKRIEPVKASIQWDKVHQLIDQGRGREIAGHLLAYVKESPDDVNANLALGLIFWREGDIEAAHKWLGLAVNSDPHNPAATLHFNRLRIEHFDVLPKDRPRVLCNVAGGRIGIAIRSVADTIFFVPGDGLERQHDVVSYDLRRHRFEDVLGRLPHGWQPDYVFLYLTEVNALPFGIEDSPAVTISIPGDSFPLQKLSLDIDFFDVVLPGIRRYKQVFESLGHPQVLYAGASAIRGSVPSLARLAPPVEAERPYDVVFIGNVGKPYYKRRTRYAHRLLQLSDRYNVLISTKRFSIEEYFQLMGRAKIVVEAPSVQGGVNMRAFEAVQFGALLMHEELDRSIEEFYRPGEEVVLFREDNLEELVEYYLRHDDERKRIVRRAQERLANRYTIHRLAVGMMQALSESGVQRRHTKAVHGWPEDVKRNVLACSDFYAGEYRRALELLQEAINLNPQEPEYLNNAGVVSYALATEQQDGAGMKEARDRLLRAIALRPEYWLARYNLLLLDQGKNVDLAIKELVVGLQDFVLTPTREAAPGLQGLCLFPEILSDRQIPSYPEEAIFWQLAVERHPRRDLNYYAELARILLWRTLGLYADRMLQSGQPRLAVEALLDALRLHPEHAELWRRLGQSFFELRKWQEAVEAFEDSLSALPLQFDTQVDLLRALVAAGRREEAQRRVEEFVRTNVWGADQGQEFRAALQHKP
jgi:tetratricopeptide (TPR) repeat protein